MNIGKARALFEAVANNDMQGKTEGEYLEAVKIIMDMETHNSISKKMIISVCKWLVEIAEKAVSPYRWIPCSERMPKNDEAVLVSHCNGVSKAWWNGRCWTNGLVKKLDTVIAWMPLPEPMKG